MISIRKSFANKLILGILVLSVIIFMVSLGILFTQSRHLIRVEALARASSADMICMFPDGFVLLMVYFFSALMTVSRPSSKEPV